MNSLCRVILFTTFLTLQAVSANADDGLQRSHESWSPQVAAVLEQAQALRFPTSLLEAKAMEGRAKRVPAVRVAAVLKAHLDSYLRARAALSDLPGERDPYKEVLAGEAIGSGASEQAVRVYFKRFPDQQLDRFSLGMDMLGMFGELEYPVRDAMRIFEAGFRSGTLDGEWRYFSRVITLTRSRGLSDEAAAKVAVEVLNEGGTVRDAMALLGLTSRGLFEERK